jgi:hypothetical protein
MTALATNTKSPTPRPRPASTVSTSIEDPTLHGVLIGGGVAANPALNYFMEQIIDATHEVATKTKIMFYNY